MKKENFAKSVERLVDPITVGSLHLLQSFNQLLPKSAQKQIVRASSKKTPYMGFVVEPYSSFLFYEIADHDKAKALLPEGFELVKTKVFSDDEPKFYCIIGCFRAHTSAFWGIRTEFYIIAEDKSTGMLSWIIVDYDTNTISYDNKNGLTSPNSARSVITINHRGRLFVDVERDDKKRKLVFDADIESGKMACLDQRLWLEGNLSIGYSRNFSDKSADIFSLRFEPCEVEKALQLPLESLNLEANTWYPGMIEKTPSQIACFPYAQHFVSDSPGHSSNLKNRDELVSADNAIDFASVEVFSTKSFKYMFILGTLFSFLVTLTFFLLWFFK